MTTSEARAALRARHTPAEPPPCPVCGEPLTEAYLGVYSCANARSVNVSRHLERSTWHRPETTPTVLAVLNERDALEAENACLRAALKEIAARTVAGSPRPYGRHLSTCNTGLGDLAREALKGEE